MKDIINGWFAYILMNNNSASFIFIGMMVLMIGILVRFQFINDTFDLRDVICSYDYKLKKQVINTAKTLLTGGFLVSSYVLVEHYSDTAFGIYIGAWVLNGGVVAWQKVFTQPKEGVLK